MLQLLPRNHQFHKPNELPRHQNKHNMEPRIHEEIYFLHRRLLHHRPSLRYHKVAETSCKSIMPLHLHHRISGESLPKLTEMTEIDRHHSLHRLNWILMIQKTFLPWDLPGKSVQWQTSIICTLIIQTFSLVTPGLLAEANFFPLRVWLSGACETDEKGVRSCLLDSIVDFDPTCALETSFIACKLNEILVPFCMTSVIQYIKTDIIHGCCDSAIEYFFSGYAASSTHVGGLENSRQLCKPEMQVFKTFENPPSPNC